jgi:hypothetical protein
VPRVPATNRVDGEDLHRTGADVKLAEPDIELETLADAEWDASNGLSRFLRADGQREQQRHHREPD